jgi:hypothetical protein
MDFKLTIIDGEKTVVYESGVRKELPKKKTKEVDVSKSLSLKINEKT